MTITSGRFSSRDADLTRREILTPEGVPLVFHIARAGDRAAAFFVDLVLLGSMVLSIWLLASLIGLVTGSAGAGSVALLGFFLVRNGYFLWFETRWQGRTPGKRRFGIRVIDAGGGMLQMDQLIVRNLTRELEWFYPLIALMNPEVIATAGPGLVRVFSVAWFAVIMGLPILNRERRRVGDLLAGTMVVQESRAWLSRDLGLPTAERETGTRSLAFTDRQLQMYGIYELQVLEQLLREQSNDVRALRVVAEKIVKKIGWAEPVESSRAFLVAFYEAQRARLEHDLLLGRARETKRDDSGD